MTKYITLDFLKCACVRALHTMAQAMLAIIGSAVVLSDVDWRMVFSAGALAFILSMLKSIAIGVPEADYTIDEEYDAMSSDLSDFLRKSEGDYEYGEKDEEIDE